MTNEVQTSGQAHVPVSASPHTPPILDSAMNTGVGADDEPEMLVGDKHQGEALPDLNGDGELSISEAEELLGAHDSPANTQTTNQIDQIDQVERAG